MKFNLPTQAAVILSAIAGVIVAFASSGIIVLEPVWQHGVEVGVTIIALFGISPIAGAAFRALLHISQGLGAFIAACLGALQIILIQVSMTPTLHGILAGVIAFAAGLGFAPAVGETVNKL